MMNIIQRNFFRLLRSGAFDENEPIEPMSPFKWRRLFQMVMAQRVVPVFAKGVANHNGDVGLNLPAEDVPHPDATDCRVTEKRRFGIGGHHRGRAAIQQQKAQQENEANHQQGDERQRDFNGDR